MTVSFTFQVLVRERSRPLPARARGHTKDSSHRAVRVLFARQDDTRRGPIKGESIDKWPSMPARTRSQHASLPSERSWVRGGFAWRDWDHRACGLEDTAQCSCRAPISLSKIDTRTLKGSKIDSRDDNTHGNSVVSKSPNAVAMFVFYLRSRSAGSLLSMCLIASVRGFSQCQNRTGRRQSLAHERRPPSLTARRRRSRCLCRTRPGGGWLYVDP